MKLMLENKFPKWCMVVRGRAPTGRIYIHYVIYQCALLRMQYVYCTTRAKTWKTSRMQQEKIEPNFSHLVQAECIFLNRDEADYPAGNASQKNLPRCIPSEQRTPPGNRDGKQQTHGSFDLAGRHDFPDSIALTRNDISAFTHHHQSPKQHRRSSMCPKGQLINNPV